jgi:hypothetical protein
VTAPVQLLVIGLDEPTFSGDVRTELELLQEAGVVRVLDVVLVRRDADGALTTLEPPEDAPAGLGQLATAFLARPAVDASEQADAPHATWSLADAVPAGTTAAVAFLEHLWAGPLRAALQQGGGTPLEEAWLSVDDLDVLNKLRSS